MDFSPFIEKIEHEEIQLFQVVGRGSFGTVRKGRWRKKDVAVKMIETEQEKNAFLVEVRQLSRVNHPNIVKFYGACTKQPVICLVMEYAEGGSLYNVLHQKPQPDYSAAHAISWAFQCASGVAYLHNMKPKALIHRDLKPPNMLLIMGGTVLKICDFGTACDLQTVMTNSKGSAAWMAPEVFESCNYSEKCDVFSWGIILWQILTRRKPFNEIGGPAFRIMWAVHSGTRPPLIQGCPKAIENLMERCWDKEPSKRPSMAEVEEKLKMIYKFFKGGDQQIMVMPSEYGDVEDEEYFSNSQDFVEQNSMAFMSSQPTCFDTSIIPPLPTLHNQDSKSRMSAPASLSCSSESLKEESQDQKTSRRQSADLRIIFEQKPIKKLGHRRTGSCGTPFLLPSDESQMEESAKASSRENIHLSGFPHTFMTLPPLNLDLTNDPQRKFSWPSNSWSGDDTPDLSDLNVHLLLEPKFQPLPPAVGCKESQKVFEDHKRAAQEFLRVETEIRLALEEKKEIEYQLYHHKNPQLQMENHQYLQEEKNRLLQFRHSLKKQLAEAKAKSGTSATSEEWVMV